MKPNNSGLVLALGFDNVGPPKLKSLPSCSTWLYTTQIKLRIRHKWDIMVATWIYKFIKRRGGVWRRNWKSGKKEQTRIHRKPWEAHLATKNWLMLFLQISQNCRFWHGKIPKFLINISTFPLGSQLCTQGCSIHNYDKIDIKRKAEKLTPSRYGYFSKNNPSNGASSVRQFTKSLWWQQTKIQ